jgi:SsrA-binding protein
MSKKSVNITNRKAKFEYEFIRTLTAGIQLLGSEVKSIRDSRVDFSDSYCYFINGELYIKNLSITQMDSHYSHEAKRDRKLLLKKRELSKLEKDLVKNLTIIPYKIFETDKSMLKMEIALGRGKKLYDKRETIKNRDIERDMQKEIKK